jgi:hypothetical protein
MRFTLDEIWEVNQAGRIRLARVAKLIDEGRRAILAFDDSNETVAANRFELNSNWRRVP